MTPTPEQQRQPRRLSKTVRKKPGTPRSSVEYWRNGRVIGVSFVPDWHREFDELFLEWEECPWGKRAKLKQSVVVNGKTTDIVGALHEWIDKKIMDQIRIRRKHYRQKA